MENNKVFVDGFKFSLPTETAPDYIKGRIWIKVAEFKEWLDRHNTNSGGVNITIKESAKGNLYAELDTWKPTKPKLDEPEPQPDYSTEVPF